jgi:hypothetical protein
VIDAVSTPALPDAAEPGELLDIDGDRYYQIARVDRLPPFLVTVASDADHWMFVSSTGALTAGRVSPEQALFPYTTDDRLHDSGEITGPRTIIRVRSQTTSEPSWRVWEPFSNRSAGLYRTSRRLAKSVRGNKLRFEETNHDLGLSFSYVWMSSSRFGFVRRATLQNLGPRPIHLELLDGLQNLLPAGVERRFQLEYSTLVDAYKEQELDRETRLGLFRLASLPADAPEPSESLRATTVWGHGLPVDSCLLSARQLDLFRSGQPVSDETLIRGERGCYFVTASLSLEAGVRQTWHQVADLEQDATDVVALFRLLRTDTDLVGQVEQDVAAGTERLLRIVASADGLSASADELQTIRHYANVLFNCMRGGIPVDGYGVSRDDLARFVAAANKQLFCRHRAFLEALPERVAHEPLVAAAQAENDPDLERLTREYLPLTFGRRHGDPSRPWNQFSIAVRDRAGKPILDYQGNWRDLFQNWEALAGSFPGYLDSMITRFVDASTADGYNPYRVTRDGFEWEVKDPNDSWSHIGYWGDHQVIYLLRLLELSARYYPGRLTDLLKRSIFTYAAVPYRIKPYAHQLADPQDTIVFDDRAHRAALARAATLGSDGKLVLDGGLEPYRVTLTEKLLVLVLAKLANYVPEAGLWLSTQRPEWNDANNALVGHGASMVTLYHLRRFLQFFRELLTTSAAGETFPVSGEVADAFGPMSEALRRHEGVLVGSFSEAQRRQMLDQLAQPWSDYRGRIYAHGFAETRAPLSRKALQSFLDSALRHLDHSIRANRRGDGLYHAYNLIKIGPENIRIRRLPEMLEGQVAVLNSGALSKADAVSVLDALRASRLYRPDQQSYLLYPDRPLPRFLEKNRLPAEGVAASALLGAMLAAGDRRLVSRDADGGVHFHADLRNARLLARALDGLAGGPYAELALAERSQILELYEQVFDHQSFTGRSGTFFKYEGLGCIYWHMASKLLVAAQEALDGPPDPQATDLLPRLRAHYHAIRQGVGPHKPPAIHGAFPIDPYSHTPAHLGAQQPGLTGQVKEDIVARWRELGLVVERGGLRFDPVLLRPSELLTAPGRFDYLDVGGAWQQIALPPGSLAFTVCQVPVIYRRAEQPRLVVTGSQGSCLRSTGAVLGPELARMLFDRTGEIRQIEAFLPLPSSQRNDPNRPVVNQ